MVENENGNFVYPQDVDSFAFDWGRLALTVAPEVNGAGRFSGGVVDLGPGQGHARHNHPGAEEIIFVISGEGEQMVEDEAGKPVVAKSRPRLHGVRARKPLPFDRSIPARADAAVRRLQSRGAREGAARSTRFPARTGQTLIGSPAPQAKTCGAPLRRMAERRPAPQEFANARLRDRHPRASKRRRRRQRRALSGAPHLLRRPQLRGARQGDGHSPAASRRSSS